MERVALIQMVSSEKIEDNLQQAETLLVQACESGARLAVLPENFAFMGAEPTDILQIAEVYGQGAIQAKISQLAKKLGLWLIAGTMPLKGNGSKIRSSCLVYDEHGLCVARYDKIHLFDVSISTQETYQETLTFERGHELVVVDTPVGKVGLSVCYDLRFPELYQQLLMQGAQLFTVPSAFTKVTGLAHWEILVRARAIENLCYVLAANQGGQHTNGRSTHGHSMIVEPWGKVLEQREAGAGIVTADIDLTGQQHVRKTFPCVDHHVLKDN